MYADGSIVPLAAYKDIKFTKSHINDNVSGKTIRIDGCQGNPFTVYKDEQGFAGGGGITWPEYRAAHMDLPLQEALRRFRTIKRGQNPNAMTGGIHI